MMSVPANVSDHCIRLLQEREQHPVSLIDFSFIGGGCINHGGRLTTSVGEYFVKWNDAHRFPKMFETEAKGLKLLKQSGSIKIPDVIGSFEGDTMQGILLEFIEGKPKSDNYWKNLGVQLAGLHKNSDDTFGLDHSNYIGSLPQFNTPRQLWLSFFIDQRLDVQVKLAVDNHRLEKDIVRKFQALYVKLPLLLPVQTPSLLHGDLWSGNVIVDQNGEPCLIDPAVYYGEREAEISFTQLFGGFSNEFYEAYDDAFPLEPGFQERVDIYNLYPLLVHVNLFGGGYASQVKSILGRFV